MKKNQERNSYENIYEIVRLIPKGRVSSYGAIAAAIGSKSGARLVGYAMNHCKNIRPKVPAHRVVNSKGLLTGKHHFDTPSQMQELLEKENIRIQDDKVVDYAKLFWDPLKELHF